MFSELLCQPMGNQNMGSLSSSGKHLSEETMQDDNLTFKG